MSRAVQTNSISIVFEVVFAEKKPENVNLSKTLYGLYVPMP